MKNVKFEFYIPLNNVIQDKANFDIANLDYDELKGIANGSIFIFFEPQRNYIILQTGIFDYLKQLMGVIEEIESGNYSPFSVSCDWYSNSLKFSYIKNSDEISIRDGNTDNFNITTKYTLFKKSFKKFYDKTMKELILYYPELINNVSFK